MGWVKVDDRLHANRKIRRLFRKSPDPLGLHLIALSYCGHEETDGFIDAEFVEERAPSPRTATRLTRALVEGGLWHPVDGGWQINDYLDFNPSREDREERRRADRIRKREERGLSEECPSGHASESERNPESVLARAPAGVGSGREEGKNGSSEGEARAREFDEFLADNQAVTGQTPPRPGTRARREVFAAFNARRDESYALDDLKLASRGAQADEHRRKHGYTSAASVLRPTKVHDLIEAGRRVGRRGGLHAVPDVEAGAIDAVFDALETLGWSGDREHPSGRAMVGDAIRVAPERMPAGDHSAVGIAKYLRTHGLFKSDDESEAA